MIITIILLSILVLVLGFTTFNTLRKLEQQEEQVEQSDKWIITIHAHLNNILDKIKDIDNKKIFENDDEVGQTFKQIKDAITTIEEL